MSHNFISNGSNIRYQEVIYCTKCGLITYHANDSHKKAEQREENVKLSYCLPDAKSDSKEEQV